MTNCIGDSFDNEGILFIFIETVRTSLQSGNFYGMIATKSQLSYRFFGSFLNPL